MRKLRHRAGGESVVCGSASPLILEEKPVMMWQACGTGRHIESTVRKLGAMNAGVQFAFPFYSIRAPEHAPVPSHPS